MEMDEAKQKDKTEKKNKRKKRRKKLTVWAIWLCSMGPFLTLLVIMLIISSSDLPSLEELENPKSNLATEVITSDDVVIGKYFKENRTNAHYHELSHYLVDALVATEDERFYDHAGVDAEALMRAVAKMGKGGGASTITQQLAKMQFHEPAKNITERIWQKLGEWIIATRIEKSYTKEEIITMYLNQFDFLNNAVGINSAARVYFNKNPKELNMQESAMLIGMAKNPSLFNPLKRPDTVKHRRMIVFSQMKKNGLINQKQYDSLRELPLGLSYTQVDHKSGMAPYFREILREELKKMFNEKDSVTGEYRFYNEEQDRPYDIYTDGLRVYTTLDSRMQEYGEWAVQEHLRHELQGDLDKFLDKKNGAYSKRPPFDNRIKEEVVEKILENAKKQTMLYKKLSGKICSECERPGTTEKKIDGTLNFVCDYNSKHIEPKKSDEEIEEIFSTPIETKVFDWGSENYEKDTVLSPMDEIRYHKRFLRSSLMSMDPRNGHVKAWVGGPNFKYFQYDMVKKGRRQVGSTFKPFVYATAISEGVITPCKTVPNIEYCVDVPYNDRRTKQWCPRNSGAKMDGLPVSYKFALAASMNNITANVISQIKPQNVIDNVEKAGVKKGILEPVPALALGVFDLSVYEMVGAISTFANNGVYVKPVIINRIEDKKGNIIFESEIEMEQVFDPHTAYTTIKMMKGVIEGVRHPVKKGKGSIGSTSMRLRARKTDRRPYGGIKAPVAGKTGTTNDNTDGWFLGLTPELVTGVWTGCEDKGVRFRSTNYGQGANMALPVWGYYMNKVYEDSTLNVSTEDFEAPDNHVDIFNNCRSQEDVTPIDPNGFDFGAGNYGEW